MMSVYYECIMYVYVCIPMNYICIYIPGTFSCVCTVSTSTPVHSGVL